MGWEDGGPNNFLPLKRGRGLLEDVNLYNIMEHFAMWKFSSHR